MFHAFYRFHLAHDQQLVLIVSQIPFVDSVVRSSDDSVGRTSGATWREPTIRDSFLGFDWAFDHGKHKALWAEIEGFLSLCSGALWQSQDRWGVYCGERFEDATRTVFHVKDYEVIAVLIRKEDKVQKPVCYASRAFCGVKERYPPMEKLAFALVTAARKLKPYFQAHTVVILTDKPLRREMNNPETVRQLALWVI